MENGGYSSTNIPTFTGRRQTDWVKDSKEKKKSSSSRTRHSTTSFIEHRVWVGVLGNFAGRKQEDSSSWRSYGVDASGGVIFRIFWGVSSKSPASGKLSLAKQLTRGYENRNIDSLNASMRRGTAGRSGGKATRTRFRAHVTSDRREGSSSYENDQTLSPLVEAIFTREILSAHWQRPPQPSPTVSVLALALLPLQLGVVA